MDSDKFDTDSVTFDIIQDQNVKYIIDSESFGLIHTHATYVCGM